VLHVIGNCLRKDRFIILIFERIFFKYQIAYRVFLLKKYLINILKLEENKDFTEKATELIARDFEMVFGDKKPTEQELFEMLSDQVAYMMQYRLDFLLSLMYRLDIDEQKIRVALSPKALIAPNIGLAHLILERQKLRIKIKQEYGKIELEDLEDGLEF
jgi:hypothetical protein